MSTAAPSIDKLLMALDRFMERNRGDFPDMPGGAPVAAAARELGALLAAPQAAPAPIQAPTWGDDPLLTIPQAMERLGVSRAWIYKMRKAGKLTITKLGGMSRIKASTVTRLLQFGTATPPP